MEGDIQRQKYETYRRKLAVVGIDIGSTSAGVSIMHRSDPSLVFCSSPQNHPYSFKEAAVMYQTPEKVWKFGEAANKRFYEDTESRIEQENPFSECPVESAGNLFCCFRGELQRCDGSVSFDEVTVRAENTLARCPLMEVYTECLRVLKDHACREIMKYNGNDVSSADAFWVLTVPTNMSEWQLGFLREAARRAGLATDTTTASNDFMLVQEAEAIAAAVECCLLHEEKGEHFTAGKRLMVLDLGGHTSVASLVDVVSTEPLRFQILPDVEHGDYGPADVFARFDEFLGEILRAANLGDRIRERPSVFAGVRQQFEAVESFRDEGYFDNDCRISLKDILDSKDENEAFATSVVTFNATHSEDNFQMAFIKRSATLIFRRRPFYGRLLSRVMDLYRRALARSNSLHGAPVQAIVMAGGLSESSTLWMVLKRDSPVPVLVPNRKSKLSWTPHATVLVGAAIIGYRRTSAL